MQINRFEAATPLHVLVLTSPKAGSGSGRDEIPRLEGQLAKQGIPCEIIDSIDRMRARLQEGQPSAQTVLIAAGGDGTLSLAASLMMEAEQNQTNPQRQSGAGPGKEFLERPNGFHWPTPNNKGAFGSVVRIVIPVA